MTKLKIEAIKDNIVSVSGKHPYQFLEVIQFSNNTQGIVLKANTDKAEVGLLNINYRHQLEVGQDATADGKLFVVNIWDNLLNSTVDVNLEVLTEYSTVTRGETPLGQRDIFVEARPIYTRREISQPLETGITVVDAILPIGKGQKQLILGDKGTGKTAIALNALMAQRDKDTINIYVGIGKKREEINEIYASLKRAEVLEQSIIFSATADETAVAKWLIPYVATAVAEYYQETGRDVVLVFDDLTNHADAYRQLSLLSGSAPGREAYPGDIFYTHSRLLERAGRYEDNFGGGSITMLPIAQTLASDISGYIPTNLISITDGQIFTSTLLFNQGKRPAINVGLSVSRIGSQAQEPIMVEAAKGMKRILAEYERQRRLSSFSTAGSLTAEQIDVQRKGLVFDLISNQSEFEVIDYHTSAILIFLLRKGFLSFYKDIEEADKLILIKNVLKVFFSRDVLGVKLRKLLRNHRLDDEIISKYIESLILPLLKYHLLSENKDLARDDEFKAKFASIRNDGRTLLSYERRGLLKGIAYEYN